MSDSPVIRCRKIVPLLGYRLRVTFSTGETGECNMMPHLHGNRFEELLDETAFRHVAIDEYGGAFWPNGADVCPDVLYDMIFPGHIAKLSARDAQ